MKLKSEHYFFIFISVLCVIFIAVIITSPPPSRTSNKPNNATENESDNKTIYKDAFIKAIATRLKVNKNILCEYGGAIDYNNVVPFSNENEFRFNNCKVMVGDRAVVIDGSVNTKVYPNGYVLESTYGLTFDSYECDIKATLYVNTDHHWALTGTFCGRQL